MQRPTDLSEGDHFSRRTAIKAAALAAAAFVPGVLAAQPSKPVTPAPKESPLFTISLAQWSLHRKLYTQHLDHLDFPKVAKQDFGIDAVEYVNSFFKHMAKDSAYLTDLKKRCTDLGVVSVLIMCDGEGALGDPDEKTRLEAVEKHKKWVEAAKFLGCHSIRVNAQSAGSFEEQQKLAADGLRRLCEFGDTHQINVIVENHGGLSSNGAWLAGVMKLTAHPRVGTLPDFGNFRVSETEQYDRYKGIEELMPFAKGVSAKSYFFDESGNETTIDFRRMLAIVLKAGYRGRIGIEYEGDKQSEDDGIRGTKKLLERLREELAKPGAIEQALAPTKPSEQPKDTK
jgi:L-ribulose-5-phosphate 3-epimerase